MNIKYIVALAAAMGFSSFASAALVTDKITVAPSKKSAVIDFKTTGDFSFDLYVDPTKDNGLILGFTPTLGTFSALKYTIFDTTPFSKTFAVNTGKSFNYLDSSTSFTNLLAGHIYKLEITGHELTNSSGNSQFKVSSTFGTISPVPEPETYAMLLAGLGLMGTIVRRRKSAISA